MSLSLSLPIPLGAAYGRADIAQNAYHEWVRDAARSLNDLEIEEAQLSNRLLKQLQFLRFMLG